MTIMSRLMAKMYKLPPAETFAIRVDRKLPVAMGDGVVLHADRYYPRNAHNLPTLLIRTPYGRSSFGLLWGHLFAERGFQVVIQSCRGTDDSGGEINAFRGEREDGLATVAWLKSQPWFDGRLGMAGASYMGFTQWTLAAEAGPELKAISTHVTSSEFRSAMYPGGAFQLEIFLQWLQITHLLRGSMLEYFSSTVNAGRVMKAGLSHLPLCEADGIVVGKTTRFWQEVLHHPEPDDWWAAEDHSQRVAEVTAPNHMISGWYDFLLPQLLRDYNTLKQAGRQPYLTIGPWSHSTNALHDTCMQETYKWLRAHLMGETHLLREARVRIFVMGANEWRDVSSWPPQNQSQHWYLQADGVLSEETPHASSPSQYRYDPADPTPNVGGATNATLGRGTCAQDNRKLEARPDVLIFTSLALEQDMEVIGPVSAELFITSSCAHTDFFVRLCDVHPDGKSMNVCDGILRLFPGQPPAEEDGCRKIEVELWPTAYRFKRGHRIRVQVSSGAFPRFARNLGTGESLLTGTTMHAADQQVFHDGNHPSAILLPVVP